MIQLPLKYIQDSLLKFKANYKLIDSYIPTHTYGLGVVLIKNQDASFLLMLDMLSMYPFAQYKEFHTNRYIKGFNTDIEIGINMWISKGVGWESLVNKWIALKEFYIPLGAAPYSSNYEDYVKTLYHLNIMYESVVELKTRNKSLNKQLDINEELSSMYDCTKQELLEHLNKHPLISND